MTKVKLKDATKELATGAGAVLSDATRVRKSADALMQSLRKLEVKFTREEEERVAREKREEQEKLRDRLEESFDVVAAKLDRLTPEEEEMAAFSQGLENILGYTPEAGWEEA